MSSRKWVVFVQGVVPTLLLLTACSSSHEVKRLGGWTGVCIDADGDGYGLQCAAGPDCNDRDPQTHVGCGQCDQASEGCACAEGSAPVACSEIPRVTSAGSLICKNGTRYCRDGAWTACEGIASYTAPPPERFLSVKHLALGGGDASVGCGDPCSPDCFQVSDDLTAHDGGTGTNVVGNPSGGITLVVNIEDAGWGDADIEDECVLGVGDDIDCDGIPDEFDPFPSSPPFESENQAIFMDLDPGQSGEQSLNIGFKLRAADIYFYLDMTDTMTDERDNLIASLTSGSYLPGGGSGIECADRDFNGSPDNELKSAGIAGNIACLIRDARLGAGWFRDIPFSNTASSDYHMFEHRQDMTSDVAAVKSALNAFATDGNNDYPEGGMQGLYSVATGDEVYAGWNRPGIPKRTGCPTETFGWPCFRESAVPIVIHFTDYGMWNGPPTESGYSYYSWLSALRKSLNYPSDTLNQMSRGTEATYRSLAGTAETLTAPEVVGSVNNAWVTYAGSTNAMSSDLTYSSGGCSGDAWNSSQQGAPDAMFRFTVSGGSSKSITISTPGTRFNASLMLRRVSGSSPVIACDNHASSGDSYAEITRTLAPGDYIAVLKGRNNGDKGWFQLSLGEKSRATSGSFGAKRYGGTGGVKEALLQKGVRVITVNSSTNSILEEQSKLLSKDTGAVNSTNQPLTFDINSNGTGLGNAVVRAVNDLAGNLAMDVNVKLLLEPENPVPGFDFSVQAVDRPGDLCDAPVGAVHQNCRPGATPQFKVSFANPHIPNHVRPNPDDPNGGWNMKLQLIGDDKYIVDEVPVYIIPEDVVPPANQFFATSGYYEQVVDGSACEGTARPDWRSLYWNASVPEGTRIKWEMCAGDTDAEVASCTLVPAADVYSGEECTSSSECPDGYCDGSGVCHYAEGPACMSDVECGTQGVCTDAGVCQWTKNPISVLPIVRAGMQGKRKMRVRVNLEPNAERLKAPAIYSWRLEYVCSAQL